MPEHVHWEGLPSPKLILLTLSVVFVVVAAGTLLVEHNCAAFHVCSNIIRDNPRAFSP